MTKPAQRARPGKTVDRDGSTSLADQVYTAAKRDVVEHRLPPDTILTEASVAEAYGVSRAPAREALKRLATTGFVRVVPRVGYIVTNVSVRDFDEIFALRFVLEPLATELAVPRLTPPDAEALEKLARQVLTIPNGPHEEQGALLAHANAAFHREVARAAGNARLERTIGGLIDELERFMHLLAYSGAIFGLLEEHLELLRTMQSGDARAAGALMREQLENDYATMRRLIIGGVAVSRAPAESAS